MSSFRAMTHVTSELFNSTESDSRQLASATLQRHSSAAVRRKPKSAGLINQKRSTISQSLTSHTPRPPTQFFKKMNSFMSAITDNQNKLSEGIFNNPLDNNYSNTNRFRPTFNRRSSKLRKFKKPLLDGTQELNFFMKTVTQEFGIAKPKFSLQLPETEEAPIHFRKSRPRLFSIFGRQQQHSFESQSSMQLKSRHKGKFSFSVEGERCF